MGRGLNTRLLLGAARIDNKRMERTIPLRNLNFSMKLPFIRAPVILKNKVCYNTNKKEGSW